MISRITEYYVVTIGAGKAGGENGIVTEERRKKQSVKSRITICVCVKEREGKGKARRQSGRHSDLASQPPPHLPKRGYENDVSPEKREWFFVPDLTKAWTGSLGSGEQCHCRDGSRGPTIRAAPGIVGGRAINGVAAYQWMVARGNVSAQEHVEKREAAVKRLAGPHLPRGGTGRRKDEACLVGRGRGRNGWLALVQIRNKANCGSLFWFDGPGQGCRT